MTQTKINKIIDKVRADIKAGAEGLVFDPGPHEYHYHGQKLCSVSHVCDLFKNEFETDKWAKIKAKQLGMTTEEVKDMWTAKSKNACDMGTDVHAYGEYLFHRFIGDYEGIDADVRAVKESVERGNLQWTPEYHAMSDVWRWLTSDKSTKLYPVAAENQIVNPELRYAGTFDLLYLAVKPDGSYGLIIFDYKTNENLFNIYKKDDKPIDRMKYPVSQYYDCNAAHYMCQLNLYQLGLERAVKDVPVWARILFWVKPVSVDLIARNDPSLYRAYPDLKMDRLANAAAEVNELKKMFQFRSEGKFAMVSLPHVAPALRKNILARIKTYGEIK